MVVETFVSSASLQTVLYGLVAGAAFGLYGYLTKRDEDESLNGQKLARTTVIYGAAGVLVVLSGSADLTPQTVEARLPATVVVGQVFDILYARLSRPRRKGSRYRWSTRPSGRGASRPQGR